MTCNELHDRMESGSERVLTEGALSADITAHIERCSACHHWIEIEVRLSRQLQLLRDNAPAVPAALDESVLKGYREHVHRAARNVVPLKVPVRSTALVWRAAIAALLLVGAIILFGSRKAASPPVTAKVQSQPNVVPPQHHSSAKTETARPSSTKKTAPHARRKTTVPRSEPVSTESAQNALPPDFRNLMYCDALSCSGAMEVIRMNLPASALGMSSPSRTSNVVAADVVIGTDGVARAIRIVN
jgi:hypothetical protein